MSEKNVSTPSEDVINAYRVIAINSLNDKIRLTELAAQETPDFSVGTLQESSSSGWQDVSAPLAITSAFIHSWISTNTPLDFGNGKRLNFKADVWGIGLGGGIVWVAGWLASPDQLVGDAQFAFSTNPVHTEIAFFKNSNPVGVLMGGGLNVQVGVFTGNGTFEWA
jgi:hypothetical protein